MRNVKIINIDGRGEVTVKEISPHSVYLSWGEEDKQKSFISLLDDSLSPKFAEIKTWYPSEIEQVVSAFLEVNSSFFTIARTLKMDGLLEEMLKAAAKYLPNAFASSFSQATQGLGLTAGHSS